MNSSATHRFQQPGPALVLGALGALGALSAQAGTEPIDTPVTQWTTVVRYADLNLDSTAGAQALYARLSTAARLVCGSKPMLIELRQMQDYRACYDAAIEQAVRKVDSERLQALHAERTSSGRVG